MNLNMKALNKMIARTQRLEKVSAKKVLFSEATMIMADSQMNYVPVDTGALRNSGFVGKVEVSRNKATIEFGYGGIAAKYAAWVHEHPRSGKTGGESPSGKKYKHWANTGGWKFLEIPINNAIKNMAVRSIDILEKEIQDAIG